MPPRLRPRAGRDRAGRRRRHYRRRIHPLTEFTEEKFIARYRLSKDAARSVLEDYKDYLRRVNRYPRGGLSVDDKFCLALRYYATGSNYSVVGDYQGVSKSTVSRAVRSVSQFLYIESDRYIKWPHRPIDKLRTAVEWHQMHGHPRVIGAVDGCHVPIRCPKENDGAYINRHQVHSINVMMVTNAHNVFTHVDPSWAGSTGDAHVYNQSQIHQQEVNRQLDPFFLIGDGGYGNSTNLFTPIRHPNGPREEAYNRWHRTARSTVERSFGLLKARWRTLDAHGGYLYHTPDTAARIITACACLHNIAQEFGVPVRDDNDYDRYRGLHADPGQPPNQPPPQANELNFVDRTNFIMNRF